MGNSRGRRRVATAIAAILSAAAQAQQAPTAENKPDLETVTITGSLLKRTDIETPSPVQVISSDDLKDSGYTNLSDVLRNLSANGQGALGQSFGQAFASGGSGIALRGLTVGGTLTLIDGQRMVAFPLSDDNQRSFVDISAIPFNAIENVEVLKDGGSAEYGADAIAGVVNIKLKKTFVGAEITAEGGTSYKRDGTGYHLAGIFGTGDLVNDGYNAYVAIDFHKTDAIDASARSGGFANLDWSGLPGGINTTPGAAGNPNITYPGSTTGYLINPNTASGQPYGFLPGCSQAAQNANQCTFAFPGLIQPPSEQTNVLAKFTKGLANDWLFSLTGSVFVSNAEQVAPSSSTNPFPGTAYGSGGQTNIAFGPGVAPHLVSYPAITLPASSPLNPYGVPANLVYNFADVGPQITDVSTTTYRLIADVKGSLLGWDVDADVGAMYASMSVKQFGDFSYGAAQTAINDGVYVPGFTNNGGSYLAPEVSFHPSSTLDVAGVQAQREVAQLPGGPLGLAVGAQYYYQAQNAQSAPSLVDGTQIGDPVYTIGSQSNVAVFTEVDAQIFKMLEVDGAVRYDHYNTYGGTATPKFGVKFAPIDMLTFRGTWGKGFRAPSISESGQSGEIFGAGATNDPILCPGGVQNVKGTLRRATDRLPGLQSQPEGGHVEQPQFRPDLRAPQQLQRVGGLVQDQVDQRHYFPVRGRWSERLHLIGPRPCRSAGPVHGHDDGRSSLSDANRDHPGRLGGVRPISIRERRHHPNRGYRYRYANPLGPGRHRQGQSAAHLDSCARVQRDGAGADLRSGWHARPVGDFGRYRKSEGSRHAVSDLGAQRRFFDGVGELHRPLQHHGPLGWSGHLSDRSGGIGDFSLRAAFHGPHTASRAVVPVLHGA
jgi:iron complex outermembrane recepter protein